VDNRIDKYCLINLIIPVVPLNSFWISDGELSSVAKKHQKINNTKTWNSKLLYGKMIFFLKIKVINKITIPGFYDDVIEISLEERAEMAKAPFNLDAYKSALDLGDIHGEDGYLTMERNSIRPTLDVNGIWGGYTGEGAKTVIASKAYAKISMRLVPGQDPDKITKLFCDHFERIAPKSVKVKTMPHHGGMPYVSPTNDDGYKAASMAMFDTFGKTPVPVRSGGSIPIVALFEQELNVKSILLGFGLDSDAIHSPNEHFGVFNYFRGIETISRFYKHFTDLK